MPAVKLVNLAVSVPVEGGAETFLHQSRSVDRVKIHDQKPVPRDPTATRSCDLGPQFTTFAVPAEGSVYCEKRARMVDRVLSPGDQARIAGHDWAMHSDCRVPAYVLPETDSDADKAFATALTAYFVSKVPDLAKAEAKAEAFITAGLGEKADGVFAYYERAIGLEPRLWLPGEEGADLPTHELLALLSAQQGEAWDEILENIVGPTALLLNPGRDNVLGQHQTTGTQATASTYMSHTANTTAPAAADTTLTGEILTSGGGLIPAQATYAHTSSTATSTQVLTRTANGSDVLPVTLGQIGMRTASAGGGTLTTKDLLSSTATLSASGDAITTTLTTTLTPS